MNITRNAPPYDPITHRKIWGPASDVPMPTCEDGQPCDLDERGTSIGRPGIAQCRRCSVVYEPSGWKRRTCRECHLEWGASTHDPCFGERLEGVVEACCGHGDPATAYIVRVKESS